MDKDSFEKLSRKAVEICSLNIIEVEFLDPDYKLNLFNNSSVNRENGYLGIGDLVSNERSFKFRWDEKAGKIDIDLQPRETNKKLKKLFSGHHTEQISDSPKRKYQFEIEYDNKKIFKAIIEVTIKTENRISKKMDYVIKVQK